MTFACYREMLDLLKLHGDVTQSITAAVSSRIPHSVSCSCWLCRGAVRTSQQPNPHVEGHHCQRRQYAARHTIPPPRCRLPRRGRTRIDDVESTIARLSCARCPTLNTLSCTSIQLQQMIFKLLWTCFRFSKVSFNTVSQCPSDKSAS